MKKSLICSILVSVFLTCCTINAFVFSPLTANALTLTNYTYARVENETTYIYKTPSTSSGMFVVPKTYFVLLLSNFDEEFYKAQYKDIVGFVLKSEVQPVKETPHTPYLENTTFRVFSSDGTDLISSPNLSQNPKTIETLETLSFVEFYGTILGEEQIEDRGSLWYFGKSKNGNFGYLYSGLCDSFSLDSIPPNIEVVSPLDNPFDDGDNSYLYNLIDINPFLKLLIIISISLPALAIIWLLFKPFNIAKLNLCKQNKNLQQNNANNKIPTTIKQKHNIKRQQGKNVETSHIAKAKKFKNWDDDML